MSATALLAAAALPAAPARASEAPAPPPRGPRIEVCFVLDTTGSMSGLIEGAKQKIWSIANGFVAAKPTPALRIGLVGYRDRGDEYVVRAHALTDDIDLVYERLQKFTAGGGGDTPESVNEALREAVRSMDWSRDEAVLKIVFLVGDAPPQMDYPQDTRYPELCEEAVRRGLIINTIQCGSIAETTPVWREIAKLAEGEFAAIPQSGAMQVVATPHDAELAELNRKIGATLVPYGAETVRRQVLAKQALAESAPAAATADRLSYNLASGKAVQGSGELLDALREGKVRLDALRAEELPEGWRGLDRDQLAARIEAVRAERSALQARIAEVSKAREAFLAEARKQAPAPVDGFDRKVNETIRAQAARKGFAY